MLTLPVQSKGSINASTLLSINRPNPNCVISADTLQSLNTPQKNPASQRTTGTHPVVQQRSIPVQHTPIPPQAVRNHPVPPLLHPVQKGQKVLLPGLSPFSKTRVCLGWNVTNPLCDLDVSAFLLGTGGKVPGDDWFVFYGQEKSPDQSTTFHFLQNTPDLEMIQVDFGKLDPSVQKIVFVLTINEAAQKGLNFSMVKDAYIRILDESGKTELTSYKMTDYYPNVISMMIGELYQHNGAWKFNAVGNGVAKDLPGLCGLYGVQVI